MWRSGTTETAFITGILFRLFPNGLSRPKVPKSSRTQISEFDTFTHALPHNTARYRTKDMATILDQPLAHVLPRNVQTKQGRRKYVFTDQIDQFIREIYLSHPGAKTRPGIHILAKKVDIPHWALKKRARELGLARTKELPWSEPELEILARYAWMSDERIRLKLKGAGYSRSVTGIHLKLRRMKFKQDPSFYSANGLAQALGLDSHVVSRWIKGGHLKAELRGTARREQQNGDIYLIREKDVRRFILEHPSEIDLRKVDQLWFLDLVTNGLVRSP